MPLGVRIYGSYRRPPAREIGLIRPYRSPPGRDASGRERPSVVEVCSGHPIWLQNADRPALTGYCIAWAMYRAAAEQVGKDGPLVPGRSPSDRARGAQVKHPGLQVLRDQGEAMRRWARELGFTPDARQRIAIGPAEEPDDGLFD